MVVLAIVVVVVEVGVVTPVVGIRLLPENIVVTRITE